MPLFRSRRDMAFAKRIAKEAIERVVGEKVTYYPISKEHTRENLYGESKEKVVDPPIDLFALVEWKEQDIKTNQFGQDIIYHLDVYVHQEYLDQIELKPTEGDMVDYDSIKFEITKIETPTQIFGKAGTFVGKKFTCQSVRESAFKISISGAVEHSERTRPDDEQRADVLYDNLTFPYSGSNQV